MPTEEQSSIRSRQGLPQGGVELSLDELAKGLATGTLSRGKAIRWMGGALLGAALASVPGMAWADDDCRRLGRECRRDSQCCSRNCIGRGDDKVCACPEGQSRCNDRCVNLKRNENHCGRCFNRCDDREECVRGECQGSCPPGETVCNGACCAEGQECVEGMCIDTTCPPERILTEGDCNCGFICNADFPPFACGQPNDCTCSKTTEGTGFCGGGGGPICEQFVECSSSDECENLFPGWKCAVDTCVNESCGFTFVGVCVPPCSPITSSVGQSVASRESSLTEVGPHGS
jgi:hypothetical protein